MFEQLLREYSISSVIERYLNNYELYCLSEINSEFHDRYAKYVDWFKNLHRWEKTDLIIKRFFKSRLDTHIDKFNAGTINNRIGLIFKLFNRPFDDILCLSLRTFNNFHTYLEFPLIKYDNTMNLSSLFQSRLPPWLTTSNTWRSYFVMFSRYEKTLICDYTNLNDIQLIESSQLPFSNPLTPAGQFDQIFNMNYPNSKGMFDTLKWSRKLNSNYNNNRNNCDNRNNCILDNYRGEYFHCSGIAHTLALFRITDKSIKRIFYQKHVSNPLEKICNPFYFVENQRLIYSKSKVWEKKSTIIFFSLVQDECKKLFKENCDINGSCVSVFYSINYDSYIFIHNRNQHLIIQHPGTPSKKVMHFFQTFPNCLEVSYDRNNDMILFLNQKLQIERLSLSPLM